MRLGKPATKVINDYQLFTNKGIDLFVQNAIGELEVTGKPRIEVERTLFGRKFVVYGFVLEDKNH